MNLRLDFNQGLDARLVNEETARMLVRVKWLRYIRFSCDTSSMVQHVNKAMRLMREAGYRKEFFIYFLAEDAEETLERITRVCESDERVTPYVMPFRDFNDGGKILNMEIQRLARWANRAWVRKSCKFSEYKF